MTAKKAKAGAAGRPSVSELEAYNALPAPARAAALKKMGIEEEDQEKLGILTKSHFVVPGSTRFECQRCGECCRYARKVAQLTYEPCPFLKQDNSCAKHDERYLVCKWFPFWIYESPRFGPMLTIKPYCSGFGKGPLVEHDAVVSRVRSLAADERREADGAFVIHEVLYVPGRRDWAFPSRSNVDALMSYIMRERLRGSQPPPPPASAEKRGEVHYAHHSTSGLLGSINSPLLTVNESGAVTDANEQGLALLRRARGEAVGETFASFFVNPDCAAAALQACFHRGKETASPQRLRLKDGETVPLLLNWTVYRDRSDGLVHGALVCLNQVPQEVFSEVSHSRDYARGLLEASLDALMVIDHDGALADVNEALVRLTGRSRTRLLGSPFRELFKDGELAARGVSRTFREESVRGYDLELRDINGEIIPVSFNATIYRDSSGGVRGIFASARDIRERLRMMRELEETRNYARGLIECCPDLMVAISRDGVISDVNAAACRMTGRPRADLVGSSFSELFDDPGRARGGVERTYDKGEVRGFELNLLGPRGAKTPVSFNASLYRGQAGRAELALAVARPL